MDMIFPKKKKDQAGKQKTKKRNLWKNSPNETEDRIGKIVGNKRALDLA